VSPVSGPRRGLQRGEGHGGHAPAVLLRSPARIFAELNPERNGQQGPQHLGRLPGGVVGQGAIGLAALDDRLAAAAREGAKPTIGLGPVTSSLP
jgi:hypothetical protein